MRACHGEGVRLDPLNVGRVYALGRLFVGIPLNCVLVEAPLEHMLVTVTLRHMLGIAVHLGWLPIKATLRCVIVKAHLFHTLNTEVVVAAVRFSRMLCSGWSPPSPPEVPMPWKGVDEVEGCGHSGGSLVCVCMHEKVIFNFLDAVWADICRSLQSKKGRLGSASGLVLGK